MASIRELMTAPVVSVRPETPLKEVAELLVDRGISGLPVVSANGDVLGIVSEADFLLKESGAPAMSHRPLAALFGESKATRERLAKIAATTAGEAMSQPAVTIEADRTVADAAAIMAERRIKRLPVIEGGRLVGIVTRADLVRAYVRSDHELAGVIRDEVLYRTMWLDPAHFEVDVRSGIASIRGSVDRRSTADIIERVTAMVPGVVGVRAEIAWDTDDREVDQPTEKRVSSYRSQRVP
jgi:CBS domain-containing protein